MSGITGMGTTFNLPNYHGELFALTPSDTPLLSAIGGLTGGGMATSTEIEWQTHDLRDPAQNVALEGATAPTAQERVRANVRNVLQIHQSKVSVSYTKQATAGMHTTPGAAPFRDGSGAPNPIGDELDWQTEQELKSIALDVNWSFINGRYQNPTSNATARKTRGLLQAITTNVTNKGTNVQTGASSATDTVTPDAAHSFSAGDKVVFSNVGDTPLVAGRVYYIQSVSTTVSFKVAATSGGAAITLGTSTDNLDYHQVWGTTLTVAHIDTFVQGVFDNGGLTGGMATFLVNSSQKRAISAAYAAAYGQANPIVHGETVGGVPIDQVLTDFGLFNIMLDRHVPQDAIVAVSLNQLRPVFLNTPGKGVFFEEPLAKTGASDEVQIYGEIGLEYGSEKAHGILQGLAI
jgi:hypothetical protein